eukprot:scaffold2499_cov129-Isochrysis_galbana.AAC.12
MDLVFDRFIEEVSMVEGVTGAARMVCKSEWDYSLILKFEDIDSLKAYMADHHDKVWGDFEPEVKELAVGNIKQQNFTQGWGHLPTCRGYCVGRCRYGADRKNSGCSGDGVDVAYALREEPRRHPLSGCGDVLGRLLSLPALDFAVLALKGAPWSRGGDATCDPLQDRGWERIWYLDLPGISGSVSGMNTEQP